MKRADIWPTMVKVFKAAVIGLACSFLAFLAMSVVIYAIDLVLSLFGAPKNSCDEYIGSLKDGFKEFLVHPALDSFKGWLNTALFQITAPSSAAAGSALTTYFLTKDDTRKAIREIVAESINVCDELWDVDGFLKELDDAMKGGNESPSEYLKRAQHLLEVWAKYKAIFDPILKDHNGDFARLKQIISGDAIPNCKTTDQSNGYLNQEVWNILSRISVTHKCRREEVVRGLKNLLDKIGVIDQNSILQRYRAPASNGLYMVSAVGFGFAFFTMLLFEIFKGH